MRDQLRFRRTIRVIAVLLTTVVATALARPPHISEPDGREKQLETLENLKLEIGEAKELPDVEGIPLLGTYLRKLSRKNTFQVPERKDLYLRTQDALLDTPGHAHYYRDLILEAKGKAFKPGQASSEPEYSQYCRERMYALLTLAELPSVETVEVLTEFLDDMDQPSNHKNDSGYFAPLAWYSRGTLHNMIADGPENYFAITAWREWRDDIRRGHRTFRFKGSDVRYDFDGPVPEKSVREDKPNPSRSGRADAGTEGEARPSAPGESGKAGAPNRALVIAAVVLAAAIGVWVYSRRAG